MDNIVGQKIKQIRPMTKEEYKAEHWEEGHTPVTVIVLENGVRLYPSRDSEGNGGGVLFGRDGTKHFAKHFGFA